MNDTDKMVVCMTYFWQGLLETHAGRKKARTF